MLLGALDSAGRLLTTTVAPSSTSSFNGGVASAANGALHIVEAAPSVFVNGFGVSNSGQLCIAPGGAIVNYAGGLPFTSNGRLVTQADLTPNANDPYVGGIRVGPLGGVYTRSDTPPVNSLPVNTTLPAITGSLVAGSTLSTTNGSWTGYPAPTFAYQWKRGVTNIGTNSASYTTVTADIGQNITCVVTATNSSGSVPATSNIVVVTSVVPVNTVAPVISGTGVVGTTLSATTGTWTSNTSPTYAYQWKSGGTNTGTNSSTYLVESNDTGAAVTCTVTATNVSGSATATSNGIVGISAPSVITAPSISGNTPVGSTLTCTPGVYTGYPVPTVARVWLVGGAVQAGETELTYVTKQVDDGLDVVARETVTNTQGSVISNSNAIIVGAVAGSGSDNFNDNTGITPDGWTPRFNLANVVWTENAGYCRRTTSSNVRSMLSNDISSNVADIDIVIKVKTSSKIASSVYGGIGIRGSGGIGTETMYYFAMRTATSSNLSQVGLLKYLNGASTTIGALIDYAWVIDTYYNMRLNAIGSALKAKIWLASEAEPSTWTIEGTDTSITAAGWNGLTGNQTANIDYDSYTYTLLSTPPSEATVFNIHPPGIWGDRTSGTVLGCAVGSWTGPNIGAITFSYQWDLDTADVGTNAATYTVPAGSTGKAVTCTVIASDGTSNVAQISNTIIIDGVDSMPYNLVVTAVPSTLTVNNGHCGNVLDCSASANVTVNSGLTAGFNFSVLMPATGNVTLTPGAGVLINGANTAITRSATNRTLALIPTATANSYVLTGV